MATRSDYCMQGRRDECDGTNLDNVAGCECSCHLKDEEKARAPGGA